MSKKPPKYILAGTFESDRKMTNPYYYLHKELFEDTKDKGDKNACNNSEKNNTLHGIQNSTD